MRALIEMEGFIDEWNRQYEKEQKQDRPPYVIYFRYHGDIDIDNMTDDELDELYRPRMNNKRKTMAPLFIYLILKEHTDWDNPLLIKDIIRLLKEEYEISLGRNAVLKHVNTLVDEDVNIWGGKRGDGYWYSEQRPKGYDY